MPPSATVALLESPPDEGAADNPVYDVHFYVQLVVELRTQLEDVAVNDPGL